MTKNIFKSFEEFEESNTAGQFETVTIIDYGNKICADLMTDTKSLKVALKRFFKQLTDFTEFDGWQECITESIDNGCYADKETYYIDGKSQYLGGWAYEVEDNEGSFYITLTVAK